MIYLDNAATGGFKPYKVLETATSIMKYLNANPGRSGHTLSQTASDYVFSCRKKLKEFFNAPNVSRVIFTKNCTESLNLCIQGGIKKGRVLTTTLEHNSVLRPLFTMQRNGLIDVTVIEPSNKRYITLDDVINSYSSDVSAVIVNAVSNVTGESSKIEEIGNFMKDKKALFIVDGAQAGGHIPIDMRWGIDALCLAGHKGLYSILGVGVLILSEKADIEPLILGGTGTETFNPYQPSVYPEKLESGTLNLPAICSLEEGVDYLENNLSYISMHLENASEFLIGKLSQIEKIKIFSNPNPCGIVSFSVGDTPSSEICEILSSKYDIAVRGGYHCAPLVHKMLKTQDNGLIRASICIHNTKRELIALYSAIKEIANCF